MEGAGTRFQRLTEYTQENVGGRMLDWEKKPPTFKRYESVQRIQLSNPELVGGMALWEVLRRRRSRREFSESSLTMEILSQLLWATQGVTGVGGGILFRTTPSAGGLFPIETYIVLNKVEGLDPGLYHLFLPEWELEFLSAGDLGGVLARAALGQEMLARAAVDFVWTAVVPRSAWKYEQRAYRYIYLDAGHVCQNLYLACESLSLGCCAVGAFFDEEVNKILGVDGENETAVYLAAVGKQPPRIS